MKKGTAYQKYLNYEESDFISDPFFQDWAFSPTPENELFWKKVEETLPEKQQTITHALLFLRSIHIKQHLPSDEQVDAAFEEHLSELRRAGTLKMQEHSVHSPALWHYIRNIAAIFVGALLIFGAYFFLLRRDTEQEDLVQTAFGETRKLSLPDGSLVQLNSNSKIRYKSHWEKGKKREIWLEGEAIFNVVHLNHNVRALRPEEYFVVHTRGLNVTVLGTIFDVRQRRNFTEVVLQKGKVKVSFTSKKLSEVLLTPGKRLVYRYNSPHTIEDKVETENYTAWKEKRLLLMNPSLREITEYLEDNFGKKIIISDKSLYNKMIAGPIPLNSLNDALFVISTVSNVEVIKVDSSTVLLKRR